METSTFEQEIVVDTAMGKKAFDVVAEIEWKYVGHDGIGQYEYWGSTYTDEGNPEYEIAQVTIESVSFYDEDSDENIEIPVANLPQIYAEAIVHYIMENAESPD